MLGTEVSIPVNDNSNQHHQRDDKKNQPIFQALKEILFTEHSDRIFSEVNNYTANYEERSLLETVDKRAK